VCQNLEAKRTLCRRTNARLTSSEKQLKEAHMSWSTELCALWAKPMLGVIDPTAYDSAWVARVPRHDDVDVPAFPSALEWLLANQHADGSWGASLEYHHDRLASTLRAALTLAHWQLRQGHSRWQDRIDAAVVAIGRHGALLSRDPYELVGFELIVPTLLNEARALGLALRFDAFQSVYRMREEKLARMPPELVYAPATTLAFSAEFLGSKLDAAKMRQVLDAQGSVSCSPSATAFYLVAAPGDPAAEAYLATVLERSGGAAPAVGFIDVFEHAWVLYSATLLWPEPDDRPPGTGAAVEHLRRELLTKRGAAYAGHFVATDLDDTAMVARVLSWAKVPWGLEILRVFEEAEHFRCYAHERNPSVSGHVHLVEALTHAPESGERARMLAKARAFLARSRVSETFWFDKWHASPYYPTAHAVLALTEDDALVGGAVRWMIETQRPDGSWGHYEAGTAEETAYALQALAVHRRQGGAVDADILARGAAFLERSPERRARRYAPLWIGKTLYTPAVVVHASVLAALALAEAQTAA
jgi:halimadienyl-diphosphate synthase